MGGKLIKYPVYTVVFLLFVLFVITPVFYTLLFFEGSFFENLKLLDKNTFYLLGKSVLLASVIAFLATFFGTILGFLLYRTGLRFRNLYKIVLMIPLFISPYILAVAWKDVFYLLSGSSDGIASETGVVLVLTFIFTPLSMLITGNAFNNINTHLEETGLMITDLKRVILKIILPLIKPALFTSFVLIFIFSISEFSVPAYFGVRTFTTEMFTQFSAFYNHSLAVLQSLLLIVICVFLLYSDRKYLADAPFLSFGGKGKLIRIYTLKKQKLYAELFVFSWFFFSVVLPFTVLLIQSFKGGTSKFLQAFDLLKPTFLGSAGLAFLGSAITVLIGFVAAYISEVRKIKTFDAFLLFIFAIPSTVFGISLIKFYNHPFLDMIYSGYAIIIIGYVGKFSFIAAKLIGNAIKQVPGSLEEAAQIGGIGFYRRIQKIIFPLILPAVFTAFIINFTFSIGELGTTIMVYPPGTEIMPIKVFTIMANAPQSLVSAMTLIVLALTLILIAGMYLIIKPFLKNYSDAYH
jgi:ABC-type Fe3+ transport system permease subunit